VATVEQRGFYITSGSVFIGDPLFGRKTSQITRIQMITTGYWHIRALNLVSKKELPFKQRILLYIYDMNYNIIQRKRSYWKYTVSGYMGVFDVRHFQAGNNGRCQRWFDYCRETVTSKGKWSNITGGFVVNMEDSIEWCEFITFSDSEGNVAMIELRI